MRLGFIGAGNIGQAHMEAFGSLRETEGIELAAIADANPAAVEECARKFDIGRRCASADDLIADREIDAVVVAVPNCWHAPIAVAALGAGKHVLLEKPMGAGLEDALAIYDKQRETGGTVMVCHQMRWTDWGLAMKQRCDAGQLGEIYHVRTGWMRRKGIPGWGTWFTSKQIAGGGPLLDLGVHMLDISLHLLGDPLPVSVSGVAAAMFGPQKRGIGAWGEPDWDGQFDVEDFASAFVRFDSGATLGLDVSWAAHIGRPGEYVDLMGKDGGLSYHSGDLRFLSEQEGEMVDEVIELPGAHERLAMSREFLGCTRTGTPPSCGPRSGLVNNAILDAVYRSSETGAEVRLDLPRLLKI